MSIKKDKRHLFGVQVFICRSSIIERQRFCPITPEKLFSDLKSKGLSKAGNSSSIISRAMVLLILWSSLANNLQITVLNSHGNFMANFEIKNSYHNKQCLRHLHELC